MERERGKEREREKGRERERVITSLEEKDKASRYIAKRKYIHRWMERNFP